LMEEARRATLRSQDDEEFFTGLAAAARQAFDLLAPALGGYATK
jgi:hypothetical protein